MSAKKSFISDMPPIFKGIIGVVVVAGVGFAAWKTYKWIQEHGKQKGSRTDLNLSQSTLNTLSNQGIRPTYSPVQYSTWSNSLQQAFDGCGLGWTTQASVWRSMKNDADIHALITAYGERTVDKCGVGTGDFKGDLPSTLAYKYSGAEGSVTGSSIAMINSILKSNGLTFKF